MGQMREQLTVALKSAQETKGLLKSKNELVWRYVNDHPGVQAKHLPSILKTETAQAVSDLKLRGMMIYTPIERRPGFTGNPGVTLKVEPKMRGVYELWPRPLMNPKQAREAAAEPSLTTELRVVTSQALASTPPLGEKPVKDVSHIKLGVQEQTKGQFIDIESLTIREARKLQADLNKLFGKL